MSRIGKTPVVIPAGVAVNLTASSISAKGKLGELSLNLCPGIAIKESDGKIIVTRKDDSREQKAFHGLTRALINNIMIGVSEGYQRELQVIGTGYSAETMGPWLKLSLGYSHDILLEVPKGLTVEAEAVPRSKGSRLGVQSIIRVKGIVKEDIGNFSAEIRKCRPPENYKGKGIRYTDEFVKIKPGKAGAK